MLWICADVVKTLALRWKGKRKAKSIVQYLNIGGADPSTCTVINGRSEAQVRNKIVQM